MTAEEASELAPHELSSLFPVMASDELESFKEDIGANGIRKPIVLHEGKILDGRHRRNVGVELGLSIPYLVYDGRCGSPWEFVRSENAGPRRSLSKSQYAMIAAQVYSVVTLSKGDLTSTIYGDLSLYSGMNGTQFRNAVGVNHQYFNLAMQLLQPTNDSGIKSLKDKLVSQVIDGRLSLEKAISQVPTIQQESSSAEEDIEPEDDVFDVQTKGPASQPDDDDDLDGFDEEEDTVVQSQPPAPEKVSSIDVKPRERILTWSVKHEPKVALSTRRSPTTPPYLTPSGQKIPESGVRAKDIQAMFASEQTYHDFASAASSLYDKVKKHLDNNPFLQQPCDALYDVIGLLTGAIPYSICPSCDGDGCDECHHRGWVGFGYGQKID